MIKYYKNMLSKGVNFLTLLFKDMVLIGSNYIFNT